MIFASNSMLSIGSDILHYTVIILRFLDGKYANNILIEVLRLYDLSGNQALENIRKQNGW